jgi:hypothetical protein
MGKKLSIKDAANYVGLSEWELRQGIKSGRYPALKVGQGRGKYIVDIDLLEARIKELMIDNIRATEREDDYGVIRRLERIV